MPVSLHSVDKKWHGLCGKAFDTAPQVSVINNPSCLVSWG